MFVPIYEIYSSILRMLHKVFVIRGVLLVPPYAHRLSYEVDIDGRVI